MNRSFFEDGDVVAGFVPVNMATADNNSDYVCLRDIDRLLIVLFKGAGTAGDDPILALQQATSAAGGSAKDLTFTELRYKCGTLASITDWTKVTQTAAASYDTDGIDGAENQLILAVEVRPDMLDVNGGFTYVRANVADIGANAQLGCLLYLAASRKNAQDTPTNINA